MRHITRMWNTVTMTKNTSENKNGDKCVICLRPLSEARTSNDWMVYYVQHFGKAHMSCSEVLNEVEGEVKRAETGRMIEIARSRISSPKV